MLRVGMPFWTLCVARRFGEVSDVCLRLEAPFRPSATYFDGAKVGNPPGSVSGPTSSGSFALTLIRGSLQRAILGPVQLTRHPCRVPPGSVSGLSRHLRRNLRRQCHRDRKADLKQLKQSQLHATPLARETLLNARPPPPARPSRRMGVWPARPAGSGPRISSPAGRSSPPWTSCRPGR